MPLDEEDIIENFEELFKQLNIFESEMHGGVKLILTKLESIDENLRYLLEEVRKYTKIRRPF